jgi:phosphoglycolate phosphatase
MMIKAVIFDLDDTLLQTRQVKWEAIKTFGRQFYNLTITSEILSQHWGKPFQEFMALLFPHTEEAEKVIEKYKSFIVQYKNIPYPDAISTLEKLFPKYAVCILSTAAKSLVFMDVKAAGLPTDKFMYIQSEEDTSVHKPDPAVFDPLIRKLSTQNIQPNEMFYTGDTLYDFKAATGAGLHFRGLANRTISKEEFENAGAETIKNLAEIIDVVQKI